MNKIALLISYLFEPFAVSLLAWILVINSLETTLLAKISWTILVSFVSGFPPLLVLIYEKRVGKVSDWLMTKRWERRDVQLAWLFGAFLLGVFFWYLQAPRVLVSLALTMILISLAVTLTNLFWKVSVHMVGVSFFVIVMLLVFSPKWLWLVLLLPLMAWSRIQLGHHTLTQITVGTIITILITYFSFSRFGLATF